MSRVGDNRVIDPKLFAYLFGGLLIFLPLIKSGYVQTFDMPWGPQPYEARSSQNYSLFLHILKYVGNISNQMIVEKITLLGIFILAAYGAHLILGIVCRGSRQAAASYIAGSIYMFNPFVYTRLMAGQWLVLLGYALLPWTIISLWQLMQHPSRRTALFATAWTAAIGLTSIHAIGFVLLAAVVLFAAAGRENIKARFGWCTAAAGGWLVVNGLWLLPFLLGKSSNALQVSGFGASQMQAFATSGTVLGSVPLSSLLLEGFWADGQGRYYVPSHLGWWWGIVAALIGILIVTGAIVAFRRRDRFAAGLAVLAVIAWWLGMGIGSSWSAGTATFLAQHIPLYRGYREPQKWLMLLALAYAYFAAIGAGRILEYVKQHKPALQPSALYAMLLLPILITPMLLLGAGGQLKSANYPSGWSKVATTLDQDTSDYKVLVLPWHIYMPISFTGRVVANPAPHYFKQQMVVSDNLELAGVPPTQNSALYRSIDNVLLPQRNVRTDAGSQLKPFNIKYVLLLHEADWRNYSWIHNQSDLKLVQRTASISLYKVTVK